MSTSLAEEALGYACRGWHIFPCWPGTKRPITEHAHLGATTDADTVAAWWAATPQANIALACAKSGVVVIDVDTYKPECQFDLIKHLIPHDTAFCRTARGGWHFYFMAEPGVRYRRSLGAGIDVKHQGYVMLAPSVFEGGTYTALAGTAMSYPPPALADLMGMTSSGVGHLHNPGQVIPSTIIREGVEYLIEPLVLSDGRVLDGPRSPRQRILDALRLAANEVDDRDSWLTLGTIAKAYGDDDEMREAWVEWCGRWVPPSGKKQDDPSEQWDSFRPERCTAGIGLFWHILAGRPHPNEKDPSPKRGA